VYNAKISTGKGKTRRKKKQKRATLKSKREMIFEQPFFDNFSDNFFSHTHILFLHSLSIAFVFVQILRFLCIFRCFHKSSTKMVVQITLLNQKFQPRRCGGDSQSSSEELMT